MNALSSSNGPENLPVLWRAHEEEFFLPDEAWCDALGLAVVEAVAGQSLCLDTANGQRSDPGLHVLISTKNESTVLSTLAQLLEPLKSEYGRLESLAQIDRQVCQRRAEELKAQYASYLQTDTLPDPQQAGFFAESLKPLESAGASTRLMECPLPGRLVLAVENGSGILATYDDLAFSALLFAAGRPRGILDLELLAKSWRQQVFDGAQLEGVGSKVICDPRVWAIVVARPETTARLLLAPEPVVAGFADCCWVVDTTQPLNPQAGIVKAASWRQIISRLRTCLSDTLAKLSIQRFNANISTGC